MMGMKEKARKEYVCAYHTGKATSSSSSHLNLFFFLIHAIRVIFFTPTKCEMECKMNCKKQHTKLNYKASPK